MRAKGSGQARGLSYDSDYRYCNIAQLIATGTSARIRSAPLGALSSTSEYSCTGTTARYNRTSIQLKIVNAQHSTCSTLITVELNWHRAIVSQGWSMEAFRNTNQFDLAPRP